MNILRRLFTPVDVSIPVESADARGRINESNAQTDYARQQQAKPTPLGSGKLIKGVVGLCAIAESLDGGEYKEKGSTPYFYDPAVSTYDNLEFKKHLIS